jgi:fucokinase
MGDVVNDCEPWGVILLTAADERQAERYRRQVSPLGSGDAVSAHGRRAFAPGRSAVLVVADPGKRLGSGGATLHALVSGAATLGVSPGELVGRKVLVLHSGGDSRRAPQFSVTGKTLAPLPLTDDRGNCVTLLDEFVRVLTAAFAGLDAGVVVASGDVLLRAQLSREHGQRLLLPADGAFAVACRADPATGSRHGVYVAGSSGRIVRMLQKASVDELRRVAAGPDGTVAVDAGVMGFAGSGAGALAEVCEGFRSWSGENASPPFDLYRDLACALAADTRRDELVEECGPNVESPREWREFLWERLHGLPFALFTPAGLSFTHLGTTEEYVAAVANGAAWEDDPRYDRSAGSWVGPGKLPPGVVCLGSVVDVAPALQGGRGLKRLVERSHLTDLSRLGTECVVSGVHDPGAPTGARGRLRLREGVVACQVPLNRRGDRVVTQLYGVQDDPKRRFCDGTATLFGVPLGDWLAQRGIAADEVWPEVRRDQRSLWNAQLYPVHELHGDWETVLWLQDEAPNPQRSSAATEGALWTGLPTSPPSSGQETGPQRGQSTIDLAPIGARRQSAIDRWRGARRLSMADIAAQADHACLAERRAELQAKRCVRELDSRVRGREDGAFTGLFERLADGDARRFVADEIEALCSSQDDPLLRARLHRAAGDVLRPLSGADSACEARLSHHYARAFQWVREAVNRGGRRCEVPSAGALPPGTEVVARCPVRVDLAGGWTDTPPQSLERGGAVLNMAVLLAARKAVSARVELTRELRLDLVSADLGVRRAVVAREEARAYDEVGDPFALHKGVLALLGVIRPDGSGDLVADLERLGCGLCLETCSGVPKGSGLGTSSILGAAAVAAVAGALGRKCDQGDLFELALRLEQMLTTGGGWQDQVGGVVGGLKVIRSDPGVPQVIHLEEVALSRELQHEFERRLVLCFTGEQRVAKNILQVVVGRYLSRQPEVMGALDEMPALVDEMHKAFRRGALATVGRLLSESWRLNRTVDPHCTNEWIDLLFAQTRDLCEGGKLVGAGGGGFMTLMAKDETAAQRLKGRLAEVGQDRGVEVYDWSLALTGLEVEVREG